ncbi:FAD-binding domain [Dillenia turbinata]|uniref:FAD-binding domain n=1 Tax=Dillenia turbinata TaxID=194707 RepID=A0AAN8VRP8_9MAGN
MQMKILEMENKEDIVIVGAGIAGLSTSLGLYRLGLRSLVLESSDGLRVSGFALTLWTNAWRALDVLGVGDCLREQHFRIDGLQTTSLATGLQTSERPLKGRTKRNHGDHEIHCVRRNILLETLAKELPHGTIRYNSKVVSIEESGCFKLVHLADGSILRTKVLIGCDGVNSVVANWLGLPKRAPSGRSSIRGLAEYTNGHCFGAKFSLYFGDGVRFGFLPCNQTSVYWFFTFTPSTQGGEQLEANQVKMKEFVLSKLARVPQAAGIVKNTTLDSISSASLKFRLPWNLLWGDISKGNVCVSGDALHPMTPDIGQGGCSALEDSVVLARCLSEALTTHSKQGTPQEEYDRIKKGLEKFARERRWRSFELISTAYLVGSIQQSDATVISFLREKLLSGFFGYILLKIADFDCGNLY